MKLILRRESARAMPFGSLAGTGYYAIQKEAAGFLHATPFDGTRVADPGTYGPEDEEMLSLQHFSDPSILIIR